MFFFILQLKKQQKTLKTSTEHETTFP